jgi:hypothetical protein
MAKEKVMKRCCQRRHVVLIPSLTFLLGVILGFLLSPVKHGMGNNSGNVTNHYYSEEEPLEVSNQEAFQ